MKQLAAIIIGVLMIGGLASAAVSEEDAASAPPGGVESKHDERKESDEDRDRREKIKAEYRARRDAERRKAEEEYYGSHTTTGDIISTVISVAAQQPRTRQKFAVGVVYAPGNGAKKSAVGVQFINREKKWGASLWLSGALDRSDDVIDAGIPHSDYHVQDQHGSYGLQALYAIGSDSSMLLIGGGLVVDQVMYTAVSNVTGWRWNNGSESRIGLAGQVGCKLRLGGRVSLNLGYDTHQSGFFGLAGDF